MAHLVSLCISAKSINSNSALAVKRAIYAELQSKKPPAIKLLYVTPELMATDTFRQLMQEVHQKGFLERLVVDEVINIQNGCICQEP